MSVGIVNHTDGTVRKIAGGLFYADCPVGGILPFGGTVVPADFLLCNGSEVLKEDYPALYAVIGDSFGTTSDNTKFVLPDLRESIPVGSGQNSTQTIETHDTYTLGQFKDDQYQSHVHNTYLKGHMTATEGDGWCTAYDQEVTGTRTTVPSTDAGYTSRSGSTTHGKQLGVNYIIKAKQTALPLEFEDALDDYVKTSDIQSTPISGNGNPISSGGVYNVLNNKADKATTLSGYNISNAYTKDEVDNLFSQHETNISWKAAVATYSDIATTYPNPQEGWTVVTTDTNIAWRYSGGEWIEISANTIPNATTQVNGLMTTTMVSKLDGIASGAEVNVQSDWNVSDSSSDAFIQNKPTIPTKTSDLTNDSNFSTSVVLTKTLSAGATSISFTNDSIGNNSKIIIYTNPYTQGVVTGATQSSTTVTITCAAQSTAIQISIEIRN